MASDELETTLDELSSEIDLEAATSGDLKAACFFRIFHDLASENGDFPDLDYTPAFKDGRGGYQVDGYAVDRERGELFLVISDFKQTGTLETLDSAALQRLFRRAENFFKLSLQSEFVNALEESSPAFEAAYAVFTNQKAIARVRLVLISNARLATRKKTVDSQIVESRTFTYNLLDLRRYADILSSTSGTEPLEIDLLELNDGNPVPCLPAYSGGNGYESYLVALPATLLAEIYGRFGARLLEQNVRSFLQARTKVNRGIISTISDEPEMFFAYNNGITVTASGISTCQMENGVVGIGSIDNMQIVNGGQTTASILYAKDLRKADLHNVFVQMKLSVVDPDKVDTIVPKISRFANTQNRISEADFFSGHPFHVEMEKISRRLIAPPRLGALNSTKWFYERARGQYADRKAYGTASQRSRFETEFPKDQVITKTDLSKYQVTFNCEPHLVSQGAQKCFLGFAGGVSKEWEKSQVTFNDTYLRDLVAKAIIFRWCDRMVGKSEWYQIDRGYKAQTVAYSVSWLIDWAGKTDKMIDLQTVWSDQEVPTGICDALERIAPVVARAIRDAPAELKNVGEYTKRQVCWKRVSDLDFDVPESVRSCLISKEELAHREKNAIEEGAIDQEIQIEKMTISCIEIAEEIRSYAKQNRLLSPQSDRALTKIGSARLPLGPAELNAFKQLCIRLQEHGYELPDSDG